MYRDTGITKNERNENGKAYTVVVFSIKYEIMFIITQSCTSFFDEASISCQYSDEFF